MAPDDDIRWPQGVTENLSDIEARILRGLIELDGDPERVAAELGMTASEVLAHQDRIFAKLGSKERMERVRAWAIANDIPKPHWTDRARWVVHRRARWVVLAVVLLVLGVVALYWFNTKLASVSLEESDGRRTWTIQQGDSVTLNAEDVRPDDRYRCALDGGSYGVNQTPARGGAGVAGPLTVAIARDGDVTFSCAEGEQPEMLLHIANSITIEES